MDGPVNTGNSTQVLQLDMDQLIEIIVIERGTTSGKNLVESDSCTLTPIALGTTLATAYGVHSVVPHSDMF